MEVTSNETRRREPANPWRSTISAANQKVTLRDIAEASGVSIGTVSMALNRKNGVSDSTRRRILDTATSLGYERVTGRLSKVPSIVSVVIEQLPVSPTSDPFNKPILSSLEASARRAGYRIALEFVGPEDEPETERWTRVSTAGIIILGGGDLGPGWVRAAVDSNVPVIMVDHFVPDLELPTIVPDNLCGAHFATRHLLDMGHERIGFIRGPSKYWTLGERMAGYMLAMQQSGRGIDSELIPPRVSHGEEKGYGEMQHLLALSEPPTALFAVSDKTAMGAYKAIVDRGLSIPDDVSVVGFDDIGEARWLNPPLTTVHVPGEVMGQMAFYRLSKFIAGDAGEVVEGTTPLKWTIPTRLVQRGSVRDARR
jgi:DNA-binding LacI/PurR family transcriptional regulator